MRTERFDHAGRTRAAIRGFIKYWVSYVQDHPKTLKL
jgi:hypothetical protein